MRSKTAVASFLCLFALSAFAAPAARQPAAPNAPFNAQNAAQVFQMSQSGGIQQVTAKDPGDKALIAAIRGYLEAEAGRFGGGDYSGTVKIEGQDVPAAKYFKTVTPRQVAIIYRNLPAGAAIDYVGRDKLTVDAIHGWFDALLSEEE